MLARYNVTDATNHDWETLMLDESGRLLIGDVGNLGHRSVRTLYEVQEPNPFARKAGQGAAQTTAYRDPSIEKPPI